MKIQYCSDLHLEFDHNIRYLKTYPVKKSGEILILAGDIIPLHDEFFNNSFFNQISDSYEQVFWVPGNHEFYYTDLKDFSESFEIKIRSNVKIVHNKEIEYKGVRLVFSTLWSAISSLREREIEQGVSDYACILNNGRKLRVKDSNHLHRQCMDFLSASLSRKHPKTVVVTHHLPSVRCNALKYLTSPVNEAFCTDYSEFIENSGVNFWIYGHSHFNQHPVYLNKTLLVTNQLGYVASNEQEGYRNNAFCVV
jgi:Icc-related predicted phosphoesterase